MLSKIITTIVKIPIFFKPVPTMVLIIILITTMVLITQILTPTIIWIKIKPIITNSISMLIISIKAPDLIQITTIIINDNLIQILTIILKLIISSIQITIIWIIIN